MTEPTEHHPAEHLYQRARLAVALVIAACGLLVVALSFAAGREGRAHAEVLLWVGRGLVWLPLLVLAVAPRVPDAHRCVAIGAQAAAQSLVKWMYAPRDFRFPDELQHLRTALEVRDHNTLAVENPSLPVSPSFPGLEAVTDALASVGRMDLFTAGTIVASATHVALAVCVLCLMWLLGLGGRLAAAAALIFALGPQHGFFNTSFLYVTPALLLMVAAIGLALDSWGAPRVTGALSVICVAGVVVTHHVTAAATVVLLAVAAGVALLGGDRERRRRLVLLAVGGVVLAAIWTFVEAANVFEYIGRPVQAAFAGSGADGTGRAVAAAPSPGLIGNGLTYLAFLTAAVLVALGLPQLVRGKSTARRLAAVVALSFFAVLGARVVTGSGELAGRGLTYTLLFASVPMAAVVLRVWAPGAPPWRGAAGGLVLTLLFTGFTVAGLPPTWEAVPGRFRIAALESGIDRRNLVAARWVASGIGPGWRTACDLGTCSALGAYGRQEALNDASPLFYASSFDAATSRYVRDTALDFAAVDVRLSRDLPVTGSYFRKDVGVGTPDRPIPRAALLKFDRASLVSRVYDNGTIRIYDLRSEGRRAP